MQFLDSYKSTFKTVYIAYKIVQLAKSSVDTVMDVINLNWLPIHESIEYNIMKCLYHSLDGRIWSSYLHLKTVQQKWVLRSNTQGNKIDFGEQHTFQSQCGIFSELLLATCQCKNKINFEKKAWQFFQVKALDWALPE